MNILLVHSGNSEEVKRIHKWKSKRDRIGNISQISIINGLEDIGSKKREEDSLFLIKQIGKAVNLYKIQNVILLTKSNVVDFKNKLEIQFPELEFEIISNY